MTSRLCLIVPIGTKNGEYGRRPVSQVDFEVRDFDLTERELADERPRLKLPRVDD